MDKLVLSLYLGSLFLLVFVVAPALLREKENKNLAGRFYGRILWRFYPIAFLLLLVYFILNAQKLIATLLMMGLGVNVGLSYYLKNLKRSLGNIDLVPYDDPKRKLFRRLSILSTLLLFANFLLALITYVK